MLKEETFHGVGGLEIFMRSYRPERPCRAVIVHVHGFKAHSGLFDWTAAQLIERGIAVYALDLRGHGRSAGDRLEVGKFEDYVSDVGQLVELARVREPGVPVFVHGHSAGGVIAIHYVLERQATLAGFICHSFAQEVPAPDVVLSLVKGISHVAPHLGVLDLPDAGFSRDPSFVERMKHDRLITHARYPSHTVAEMARADDRMRRELQLITLPVLILHGTKDKVTVPHGSQLFYEKAGSLDKTLTLYEGHYHDLLNDLDRDKVFADIMRWIDARVVART